VAWLFQLLFASVLDLLLVHIMQLTKWN